MIGLSTRCIIFVTLLLLVNIVESKKLRFASPLQSLTIWDVESKSTSSTPEFIRNDANNTISKNSTQARQTFLSKYKVALKTENDERIKISQNDVATENEIEELAKASSMKNWFTKASTIETKKRLMQEAAIDTIVDNAVEDYCLKEEEQNANNNKKNPNQYQFVGIIQKKDPSLGEEEQQQQKENESIKWYARKKPKNANWSLRVIHVDREALVTDLFRRGKVDIFASYKNTGEKKILKPTFDEEGNEIENNAIPSLANKVEGQYHVVERSWRTLWNFRPKHFFTDGSGHYYREKRIKKGLYSDGKDVYESSYDYKQGKNGLHKLSTIDQFVQSKKVDFNVKKELLKRFKEDSPDLVYDLK